MSPLVSILVPSYNHARFLGECLASIRRQTYTNWEVILIDDVSTDGSYEVAQNLTKGETRIHVSQNPTNSGTYQTLQNALDQAQGEYIAVLNSDDRWAPEKLSKQIGVLKKHPEASWCFTLGKTISEDSQVIDAEDKTHGDWPQSELIDLLPYLIIENRILASSVIFRRESLAFRTNQKYSGDWSALIEASLRGKAACIAEPLNEWRMHSHNTFRRSAGQVSEEIEMRKAILDSFNEPQASLAECSRHLSALYVLVGDRSRAISSAWLAVRLSPVSANFKRLVACLLPNAIERLFPGESVIPIQQTTPITKFHKGA